MPYWSTALLMHLFPAKDWGETYPHISANIPPMKVIKIFLEMFIYISKIVP